ncbi:unnamed protein product [Dicrocoelium dendriticum]|nr:unnamed protein product [Dicrocoelium dendriticum]
MSCSLSVEETKVIYYIDEEETPYLVKINVAPTLVTLGDFKNALNRPHYKFFFKSLDDDFGVVKEEIFDDNTPLPCFNGRVVSWLVTAEDSTTSESTPFDVNGEGVPRSKLAVSAADSGPHSNRCDVHASISSAQHNHTTAAPADSTSTTLNACSNGVQHGDVDNESVHSANQDRIAPLRNFHNYKAGARHGVAPHCGHHGGHLPYGHPGNNRHRPHRIYGTSGANPSSGTYETPSSMLSSDLESTSFFDSEDESSRFSSVTGTTLSSRRYGRVRQRRRRRPPISRASSFSSITDSTMSLNIVSVTLNMDTVNFLGISIVGQSNKTGDGGIYVGSIMKGGAVAQDGRIEPGDMILEVNGISFEEMSNDDAVRTLREQVQRPGPITLVVAKCWDPNPRGRYFTIPRQEPVRPIDPRAWVLHTNAMTSDTMGNDPQLMLNGTPMTGPSSGGESSSTLSPSGAADLTPGMSMGTLTSGQTSMPLGTSAAAYNMAALLAASQQQQRNRRDSHQPPMQQLPPSHSQLPHPNFYPVPNMMLPQGYTQQVTPSVVTASSSLPEIERYSEPIPLTVNTDVTTVISAMIQPDSGLQIRDRVWLKLTVPNAFIGSDLVDWLYRHLDGFPDRRSARKYASSLLKSGYIKHTVNKTTFSEQCYYVFRELTGHMSCLSLEEVDSVSELGSLPPPNWGQNTTSTNLTVGMTNNMLTNSDLLAGFIPASTGPHPAANGSVGFSEGGSSQYSSVPPTYHPPLTAPIRQLIADGQDATAAVASKRAQGLQRVLSTTRDNIPGYSDSSSSSDSDLDQFGHAPKRDAKQQQNGFVASALNDSNFVSGAKDLGTSPYRASHNIQGLSIHMRPQRTQMNSHVLPSTCQKNKDVSAFSTASSSTSEGNHRDSSNCRQTDARGRAHEALLQESVPSSKSSSSSSCAPLQSGHSVEQTQFNRFFTSQHSPIPPPPPPPPRISTAISGLILTSHP